MNKNEGQKQNKIMLKIILAGDTVAGKTAIVCRLLFGKYVSPYLATIGVGFTTKEMEISWKKGQEINHKKITLALYDIGSTKYTISLRPIYYEGANGALFVFDLSSKNSLHNVESYIQEAKDTLGKLPPSIIVGNKKELRDERTETECLSPGEGENFAKAMSEKFGITIPYMEVSAKTGENVKELFETIGRMVLESKSTEEQ